MASDLAIINPQTIHSELQKMRSQMEAALPRHMTPDRMARIALTQLRTNPKLMACTRESFFASLMAASQLGLEPGVNGQCYLIPYKVTCTLIPGWRGYMDLVNRTERATASTQAVYDGDEFDYSLGTKMEIHHKRGKWAGVEAALKFVYAVGHIKGMESFPQIDVWDIDKIWAHRDNNNKCFNKNDHYSFKHPEMYARKIPLLQVIKYLPTSIELNNASALDITGSEGRQSLTIDMALKGELETGGESDQEVIQPDEEVDKLFEQLGKTEAQRTMLRKNHEENRDKLVELLKNQIAAQNTESAAEKKPTAAKAKATPKTVEAKVESKAEAKPVEKKPEPDAGSFNF